MPTAQPNQQTACKAVRGIATLLSFLLLLWCEAPAQDSVRKLSFRVVLYGRSGERTEGFLKNVTDSTVVVSPQKTAYGGEAGPNDVVFRAAQLQRLRFRRTSALGTGAAIGAGTGALLGFGVGAATSKASAPGSFQIVSPEVATGMAAILGAVTGAVVGTLIGAAGWHSRTIKGPESLLDLRRYFLQRLARNGEAAASP